MRVIKKILSYPLSVLHYLAFLLIILIFHPIQWLSLKLGGYRAHKKSVDYLSWFLNKSLLFLGTTVKFNNRHKIPEGVPLIIVSNHQSMYDITGLGWYLRKYHPKFVSKIELGKGIPSISFNLNHGGSVLIDRKNPRQSLPALKAFAEGLEKKKHSAVIFPEGTRSRTGHPKPWRETGLKIMVKHMPSAWILPVTINNSWKIVRFGAFPLDVFNRVTFEVHQPVKADSMPFEELFEKVQKTVNAGH